MAERTNKNWSRAFSRSYAFARQTWLFPAYSTAAATTLVTLVAALFAFLFLIRGRLIPVMGLVLFVIWFAHWAKRTNRPRPPVSSRRVWAERIGYGVLMFGLLAVGQWIADRETAGGGAASRDSHTAALLHVVGQGCTMLGLIACSFIVGTFRPTPAADDLHKAEPPPLA
ncbi:MAG: hypothetical protein QM754_13900 [Tepidisphaeraceae bacterium]